MFKNHRVTTKDLYIGKPEAEAENIMHNGRVKPFFEDFLHIDKQVNDNGCFIIAGRKGSGKSAYAVQLQTQAEKTNSKLFCELIKKDEFDLEAAMQSLSSSVDLKYEALFEWIILTRLVKLVINSKEGQHVSQVKALREFYRKNAGMVEINKYVVAEILVNKEVNFSPLKSGFARFTRFFGTKSIKAPFYQMVVPLRETLREVLSMEIFKGHIFYILFDDLDVKFKLNNETDRVMLMDLVRIARRYNTDYFNKLSVKVLLFMRDDIVERITGVDCDTSKIFSSYEYCISWYEHNMAQKDERFILLRKFINRRLKIAFEECGIDFDRDDPWNTLVSKNGFDEKSSFKYVLDYTFYLPRDLISLFKNIGNMELQIPLSRDDIDMLLKQYCKVKKDEICDGLTVLYSRSQIDSIFSCLREISRMWDVKYGTVLEQLKKRGLDEKDFQNLIDYDLLVPVDSQDRMFFRYREQEFYGEYHACTFRTPKILSLYLKNS